jgi:APAF-1 helical domain
MVEIGNLSPIDVEYILNLPDHLFSGEMLEDMYEILTEPDFIKYKSTEHNPQFIIEDYALALNSETQITGDKKMT